MKNYLVVLVFFLPIHPMDIDSGQLKEVESVDEALQVRIGQLVEKKPQLAPQWHDFFVYNPNNYSYMSADEYCKFIKPHELQPVADFLKRVASSEKQVSVIDPIFAAHKDFKKTWVARSMLLHAVDAGCTVTAQKLLDHKVDAGRISSFFTQFWKGTLPLNLAVKKRDFAMVQLLLNAGADPNLYDSDGMSNEGTALMVALESYFCAQDTAIDTKVITLLLARKASPHARMLLSSKLITYSSLPQEAIARYQKYEYWEHNRRLTHNKDIRAHTATELAHNLCLDDWVKEFEKHKQP